MPVRLASELRRRFAWRRDLSGSSSAVETRCVVTVERRVALGEPVVGRVVALRWSQTKLTA
ncbi:hypothetical protein [Gordonia malaquae]|uniref:hypothetical protein n=1 Tax=Gordonia malaquae TaxID=410332 RepID=UPI000348B8AE|nr:hypothetical protein [Gordonia malaquae]